MARFEAAEFGKAAAADVPAAKAALAEVIGSGHYPERAVALVTEALASMSPDDPEALRLRRTLARFTQKIDEPEPAKRMFAELIEDCRDRLGPDPPGHPGGRAAGSRTARRVPVIQRGSMAARGADQRPRPGVWTGPRKTLKARHLHAIWTGRQGNRIRAIELFTEQLADRTRIQSPDHPSVLSTRFQIAVWTSNADHPERATELFTQLLPDSIRVLGEHHPHTVSTRYRLGLSARDAGRLDLATEQFDIVHTEWRKRFGSDSAEVRRIRELIARLEAR